MLDCSTVCRAAISAVRRTTRMRCFSGSSSSSATGSSPSCPFTGASSITWSSSRVCDGMVAVNAVPRKLLRRMLGARDFEISKVALSNQQKVPRLRRRAPHVNPHKDNPHFFFFNSFSTPIDSLRVLKN